MPVLEFIGAPGVGKSFACNKFLYSCQNIKELESKKSFVENNYYWIKENIETFQPDNIVIALLPSLITNLSKFNLKDSSIFYKETLFYHEMFLNLKVNIALEEGYFQIFCPQLLFLSRFLPSKQLFKREVASGYTLVLVKRPNASIVKVLLERQTRPETFKQSIENLDRANLLEKFVESKVNQQTKLADLYRRAGGQVLPHIYHV